MAARRTICTLGTSFLAIVFFCSAFQATGLAQSPQDLYRTGPDPIAPELPARDVDPGAKEEGAADEKDGKDKLEMLDMSLQQLSKVSVAPSLDMEVSTVARTESTVGRSPAAVYVLTSEMIKRSGARNLPEVLRTVPGVNVTRITKHGWAISIRGFNDRYANKLLVQIDGRAVYTPVYGGVWWDMQQIILEDIERIEVVRGPGGTVWGANAVNGVINIVTKSSADTRGTYAYSGGGSEHRSFNAVRTGGRSGDLDWRIYGMQADDGPGYTTLPGGAWDAMQFAQGGFRMDWTPTCCDTLTLQGDFFGGQEHLQQILMMVPSIDPADTRATNFLGRWTRRLSDEADWSVQSTTTTRTARSAARRCSCSARTRSISTASGTPSSAGVTRSSAGSATGTTRSWQTPASRLPRSSHPRMPSTSSATSCKTRSCCVPIGST